MTNELGIAWAAGFFDGEGAIIINRNNSTGQIAHWIQASQKVELPLLHLARMFGGRVAKRNNGVYEWKLYGAKAVNFLQTVRPYLLVKHEQADLVCEFYRECSGSSDREKKMSYYWRLQKMHVKGQHLRTGANAVAVPS